MELSEIESEHSNWEILEAYLILGSHFVWKIKIITSSLSCLTTCVHGTFPLLTHGGTWSYFYLNAECIITEFALKDNIEEEAYFFFPGKDQKICSRWLKFSAPGEWGLPMKTNSSMSAVGKKCQEILCHRYRIASTPIIQTPILSSELTPPAMVSMISRCFQNHSDAKECQQASWDF